MDAASPGLRTRPLRRVEPEDLRLYRAALEWDLEDPIVIESVEDLKSEYRWREKLKPYEHQVTNLITFCRRLPVTLLADDVGLGKTISAGLVASELIARSRVARILIVCPKLLIPQWKEELETKFDIEGVEAPGGALLGAEPTGDIGAVITTYHSARNHLEKIPQDRFQMLVLDEAHKLRNLYGVPQTPKVAQLFRKVLADRMFKYVLMLTATPIQNRLWDIYSLVDLLTAARGHQNPFGGDGMFARNFIADKRTQARRLNPERKAEFRSIVYSYMSRIRRADANLEFPERKVLPRWVHPSPGELELIGTIAKPIQKLSALAQISILLALTSSPEALRAQLNNMARKGTIQEELAARVREIVGGMRSSAKLEGVARLIDELQGSEGKDWRMVIFTHRLETQTTIQNFLETRGIKVGIINGASGPRNQETIRRFRQDPPEIHAIVSTEAGSEGVNLQAANVLVNYDLPWNPMIVEQRIGRIQRLASKHKFVCIYNVTLQGTFEEYIVGRLMEKLQMASHAIGDVEALLEASGLDDGGDDDRPTAFEEQVRRLVVASLAGMDWKRAVERAEASIKKAEEELAKQQDTINNLLGPNEPLKKGPRAPMLPPVVRSMEADVFARTALERAGAIIEAAQDGQFVVEIDGKRHQAKFGGNPQERRNGATVYAPGSSAFERLVRRIIHAPVHCVEDGARNASPEALGREWAHAFGATPVRVRDRSVWRLFSGTALIRVRATVAHDSYERLVEVACSPTVHRRSFGAEGGEPLPANIADPALVGVDAVPLWKAAGEDEGIEEFCRFYKERMVEEVTLAGDDARKRKKLEDDFTPRLDCSLVALTGVSDHHHEIDVEYQFENSGKYVSRVMVVPSSASVSGTPEFDTCTLTQRQVPADCLGVCAVSGKKALQHLLMASEVSSRVAFPEHTVVCSLSGKRLIADETERSDVTGNTVDRTLLAISSVTGKKGEPEHFGQCAFTRATCLKTELATSELSGQPYRIDERTSSALSGKSGHRSEFTSCAVTRKVLASAEAERCEVTGKQVMPGILQQCALSGKMVLPSMIEISGITHRPVISSLLRTSAVSGVRAEPDHLGRCEFTGVDALRSELQVSGASGRRFRQDEAAQSAVSHLIGHRSEFVVCSQTGQPLLPSEAERCELTGAIVRPGILDECAVSGRRVVPSQLVRCAATGRKALSRYVVMSSVSGVPILENVAVHSMHGNWCAPEEAGSCLWGGAMVHPEDLRYCHLSGVPIHARFGTGELKSILLPLRDVVFGHRRTRDRYDVWGEVGARASEALRGARCQVEAAQSSPDGRHLAVSVEVRTMLGLRTQHAGLVYSLEDGAIVGRIALGKRRNDGWATTTAA